MEVIAFLKCLLLYVIVAIVTALALYGCVLMLEALGDAQKSS